MIRVVGLVCVGLTLSGCAGLLRRETPIVVSDYCENDQLLKPSRKDTQLTLTQIAVHNAKYRSVCLSSEPKP